MRYNVLGRTGLLVSELCLGTMTFGGEGIWGAIGRQQQDEVNQLTKKAVDAGINFIDTANIYSTGQSEQLLGQAVKDLGIPRHEVVLATKVRGRMGDGVNSVGLSRAHIMHEVDASLRRMGTDYIDLYQIHGVDPLTPFDETMRALEDCVRQGKVRYLGCSNLQAWQIMKANGIAASYHGARFESVQAFYAVSVRDLEREIMPLMNAEQVGLMVWSPLAGGLLSGKYTRDNQSPDDARRSQFDFPPVDKERAFNCIEAMQKIGQAHSVSVAQIALAWLLHQQHVTSVIIGAKKMHQLEDNLAAVNVRLSEDELAHLTQVSALPQEYPGWMLDFQAQDRLPGAALGVDENQDQPDA